MPGLPADAHGFIPIDDHGRVHDTPGVWAVGDGTTFPLKQGGIAAQQAVAVAEMIAAAAGAPVTPQPFRPELRAKLITGARPTYLREVIVGGAGSDSSEASEEPLWWPPTKIAAAHSASTSSGRAAHDPRDGPARVVIAGAGVAGLEALLALDALAAGHVAMTVLAPERTFVMGAASVGTPFGRGEPPQHDVASIVAEHGARLVADALHRVHLGDRCAITRGGERLPFDALLVAVGARAQVGVPGGADLPGRARRGRDLRDAAGARGGPRCQRGVRRSARADVATAAVRAGAD